MTELPPRILSAEEARKRACMCRSRQYELVKSGQFPRPIKLTKKQIGFLESEVSAWILARVAERDGALQ
jgi:prophage regulatory protein